MASINGVQIKNLKTFRGHEWEECAQGSVYLNGKKLGFWSQDSWGGPDSFDFDASVLDEARLNFKEGFPKDYKYIDVCDSLDVFMGELLKLTHLEKDLGKYFRKGWKNAVVVTDGIYQACLTTSYDHDDQFILDKCEDSIRKMKDGMLKDARAFVVRPGDFSIKVDTDHKAPELFFSR